MDANIGKTKCITLIFSKISEENKRNVIGISFHLNGRKYFARGVFLRIVIGTVHFGCIFDTLVPIQWLHTEKSRGRF
jgi:hypothetical protein